ncbi:FHIPEP family type III secretion protein [Edwardsiella anguillarum]|nr:FHIPEP family type III secretion protein [Edwardsiella anguillarum]
MSAGDAAATYAILSVGDGLIAQIPALLISIAAGIIVTRVPGKAGVTLPVSSPSRSCASVRRCGSLPRCWPCLPPCPASLP